MAGTQHTVTLSIPLPLLFHIIEEQHHINTSSINQKIITLSQKLSLLSPAASPRTSISTAPSRQPTTPQHLARRPRLIFTMASKPTRSLMQSLLEGSVPDDTPLTYSGPPIGFSALNLNHITPIGYAITTVAGNPKAPRPRYSIDCQYTGCFVCFPKVSEVRSQSTTCAERAMLT